MKMIAGAFLVIFLRQQCQQSAKTNPDPSYAHVYAKLDGNWKGTFTIYHWPQAQSKAYAVPNPLTKTFFQSLPLVATDSLEVEQTYRSLSPYLQEVEIVDTYVNETGESRMVRSKGVNKVEGDQLICIVNKPDEQVVHQGSSPALNTIIWQREVQAPFKKEYFLETVQDSTYTIYGYGYYDQDNPKKNPLTWFEGIYKRQRS